MLSVLCALGVVAGQPRGRLTNNHVRHYPQVVAVDPPRWLPPTTSVSTHITLSVAAGAEAREAGYVLRDALQATGLGAAASAALSGAYMHFEDQLVLVGHVGLELYDGTRLFSIADLHRIAPLAERALQQYMARHTGRLPQVGTTRNGVLLLAGLVALLLAGLAAEHCGCAGAAQPHSMPCLMPHTQCPALATPQNLLTVEGSNPSSNGLHFMNGWGDPGHDEQQLNGNIPSNHASADAAVTPMPGSTATRSPPGGRSHYSPLGPRALTPTPAMLANLPAHTPLPRSPGAVPSPAAPSSPDRGAGGAFSLNPPALAASVAGQLNPLLGLWGTATQQDGGMHSGGTTPSAPSTPCGCFAHGQEAAAAAIAAAAAALPPHLGVGGCSPPPAALPSPSSLLVGEWGCAVGGASSSPTSASHSPQRAAFGAAAVHSPQRAAFNSPPLKPRSRCDSGSGGSRAGSMDGGSRFDSSGDGAERVCFRSNVRLGDVVVVLLLAGGAGLAGRVAEHLLDDLYQPEGEFWFLGRGCSSGIVGLYSGRRVNLLLLTLRLMLALIPWCW